jgi:rhodanese-related sulfurtransferase
MHLKLLFTPDGRILGAQIVGRDGVDKRIDVLATAMQAGSTVFDLQDLELAYAPPYGSAKDPVNFAGFVAANALSGKTDLAHADALPEGALLLDVREPAEFEAGAIPGGMLLPLGDLRGRLAELPADREIVAYCAVGIRGYLAERILKQNGFRARNLSGGYTTWKLFQAVKKPAPPAALLPLADPVS